MFVARLGTKTGTLLIGTIFAAAGWLVTFTVENFISVPTVEYDMDLSEKGNGRVAVTVTNLSRDHKFSNLKFILQLPLNSSSKFKESAIEPIPPLYSSREPTDQQDFDISYPTISLHPDSSIRLTASYSGDTMPIFYIEPSSEGVRLHAKGLLTWIIRNELEILFGLFMAWAFIVVVALVKTTGVRNGS